MRLGRASCSVFMYCLSVHQIKYLAASWEAVEVGKTVVEGNRELNDLFSAVEAGRRAQFYDRASSSGLLIARRR